MSNNPVSFIDPDGLTDVNHYESPMFFAPGNEGRSSWGRRYVEDPNGHGGNLLDEGITYDAVYACSVENEMRSMMATMDGNLAVFESNFANFEAWSIAVVNEQYKNNLNENVRETEQAPPEAEPENSHPAQNEFADEIAQVIGDAQTGLMFGGPGGEGERDWFDKTQIGIEAYGVSNSSKTKLINYAAKSDASINNLKYVKGVKAISKGIVIAGAAAVMYEAYDDAFNKGNYCSAGTRLAVAGVAAGAAFIPFVGWGIASGIGLADAIWGDQFYNWVELNLRKEQ
mgnify:CR=1 FL=1